MVYTFDLQRALHVNYIEPLQKLEISNIQDHESLIHKPEEKLNEDEKQNPSFEPKLVSENNFDKDPMKEVKEMLEAAKADQLLENAGDLMAAETQLKQGNFMAAEYFLKESGIKLKSNGLTIDRNKLTNQYEKDLEYIKLTDDIRILQFVIKAEERFESLSNKEKQQ